MSSKNASTASALFLSTPKSKRVAPSVAPPSNILNIPEPIPASIDCVTPMSLFSLISPVCLREGKVVGL